MSNEQYVLINQDLDIVAARQKGRELAIQIGFSGGDVTLIVTAISELARNIISYANRGVITLEHIQENDKSGILIVAKDHGPGIANIEDAMRDGFSTGNSLGIGLPGTKRLMDDFEIVSKPGKGTTVTIKKWMR